MTVRMGLHGNDFECEVKVDNSIVVDVNRDDLKRYVGSSVASIIMDYDVHGISILEVMDRGVV